MPECISQETIEPVIFTVQGYQVAKLEHIISLKPSLRPLYPKAHKPSRQRLLHSPFSSSGLITDTTIRIWQYKDESGQTQGPFTALEMDNWYNNGYFANHLPIKLSTMNSFMKLAEMLFLRHPQ